jgi:hypothetical protein
VYDGSRWVSSRVGSHRTTQRWRRYGTNYRMGLGGCSCHMRESSPGRITELGCYHSGSVHCKSSTRYPCRSKPSERRNGRIEND